MIPEGGTGKIMVAVPRERVQLPSFIDSRDWLVDELRKQGLLANLQQIGGCRIDHNRNVLAQALLEQNKDAEWMQFLDNDMVFPYCMPQVLASRKMPVIGGLYFRTDEYNEPIVYRLGKMAKAQFGGMVQMYDSMRAEVYEFLMANNIPPLRGPVKIDNPIGDPLLQCDGLGTGAMLIHRSVLEALEPPWFTFNDEEGEDLRFCRRVRDELGLPIYVDMTMICGHIDMVAVGPTQFMENYHNRGRIMSTYKTEHCLHWISEFFGVSEEDAKEGFEGYKYEMMAELWKEYAPWGSADVERFYRDERVGRMYVAELLHYNASPIYKRLRSEMVPHWDLSVMDIGGGIGTLAIQLAMQRCNVTVVEPNPLLRDFINYRWEWYLNNLTRHGHYGTITVVDDLPSTGHFDLVTGVDVFEHIHPDELLRMLRKIGKLQAVRDGFFHKNNFGEQDVFPHHYDHREQWEEWLKRAGYFMSKPPLWSIKVR